MTEISKSFPYEIRNVEPQESAELFKLFSEGIQDGWVRVGPKNYIYPVSYVEDAERIYNFPLRSDDVWVVSYPKSGTTLTQELVWMVANNCDYETSAAKYLFRRFPYIEMGMFLNSSKSIKLMKEVEATGNEEMISLAQNVFCSHVSHAENMPSPRFIKSHLPLSLVPPAILDTCKVIHVARDPRDVAVSFFHHCSFMRIHYDTVRITGFTGSFKQFWNLFINDKVDCTLFFPMVKEWWAKKDHPNLLFLFYEDLVKDMPTQIRKVAKFLGKSMSDEQVDLLSEHLRFDNFKKNKSLNYDILQELCVSKANKSFVRKGKSGGWRDYYDDEMREQADRWIEENLKDCDLRFPSYN
ncbi:hypothetical protein ACJJTC_006591 [Scirpophaga incertulas]